MGEELLPLFVGFILTTVAGGFLGSFLQTRLWRHQWAAERASKTSEAARSLFEDVSRLMDRRLFRLSQLTLWSNRGEPERLAEAITEYRTVVREWNDSISRHLSLLQFYFGTRVRERFDFEVGQRFVAAGAMAETLYRAAPKGDASLTEKVEQAIVELRADVYQYNLELLRCMEKIQESSRPTFLGSSSKSAKP
jgi:hypothetical protein